MKELKFKILSYRLVRIMSSLLVLCLIYNQGNAQELKSSKGLGLVANATKNKEAIPIHFRGEADNGIANISVGNSEISLLSDCDGIVNIGNKKQGNRESLTAYEFPQIQVWEAKGRASAAINVSGIIDASTLEDNAELVLTGNTNLFMDVNKTLKCITGDYSLTLSGGNILTLNDPENYAIDVSSVTISAPLIVKSSSIAIAAESDIIINNTVNATSTNTCIGTMGGTITINADVTATTNSSAAILNRGLKNGGDIIINKGTITATGGNSGTWAYGIAAMGNITAKEGTVIHVSGGTGIYAETGNIHLAGEVTANANGDYGSGVYAQAGEVSLSTISISSSGVGISAYNGLTLNGVTITNTADTGLGTVNGTLTINADVTATTAKSAAILSRGRDQGGDIIINSGTITATGGNTGIWAYGIAARGSITSQAGTIINATGGTGIYAEDGNIHLAGNVVSVAKSKTGYGVYAEAGEVSLSTISVPSSYVGISANNGLTLNGDVEVNSADTGIGTVNGTLIINADVTVTTNRSAAILNRGLDNGGDIIINNGVIKATGGNSGTWAYGIAARGSITSQAGTIINATGGTGIYAEDGNIHLAGNVVSVAKSKTGYGVYAEAGEVSLSTISVPSSYVGISANNGLTLNGDVEVNSADTGIGTVNGTLIINADVTVTTNSSAAILNRGINGGGDIIINKGTITATGGNSGTWAYGIAAGGNINIKSGKVVAKGGSKGILAQNGTISITPPLIVITAAGGGISADGHTVVYDNGKVATRVVIMDPPIAGVVALNSTPAPGNSVGFTVSGDFATSEISNVWQISDDNVTWQDIVENVSAMTATIQGEYKQQSVATDITYTPKESEIGKYIRVKVSASDYSGYIYSPSRQIAKLLCTNAPAEPVLTNINDKVHLSNAKTTQEYIIFNYSKEASSLTANDWSNAVTPESEVGFFEMNSTTNANHTVFTRIKETTSTLASENVAEARLYIGTSIYLTDIELNITKTVGYFQKINNELNCKVGDVIRCDASPVPSDATNWYGISGSNWTVDYRNTGSPYGTFYEDANCTRPISSSSNYTTVYLKTLATKNYLDVRIQAYNSAIGYKTRYVQFNVTPDGYFPLLDYITNCSMTIAVGEKITGIEVGRRPFSGSVYGLTTEVSGEGSAPIVRFDMYEKMNIDATNATSGVYTYTPIQDGNPLTSTFTITVTDGHYDVDSVLMREKYIVADPGERVELVAQLMPANSEAEIQWTSSNTSVATVTDGIVTIADNAAIGAAVTITASANGKSDECKITVSGEEYGLYVASIQVTSRNRDDILGDGKFSFDGLRTLTINGDYTVSNSSNFVRNTGIDDLNIEVAQACIISQDSESYSTLFDIRKNTILRGEQLTVNGNGVAFGTQGGITLTLDSANLIVSAIMPFKGSNLSSDSLSIINSRVEVHASGSAAVFNFEGGISLTDCYIQTPAGGEVVDAAIEDGNGNHVRDMVIVPLLMLYDDSDNTAVLETFVASGKTTHVQLVNRTFYKDNSWTTLCLPFDVDNLNGTPLEGATIMELNTISNNGFDNATGTLYLSFKTVTAIESGKPYIVKWGGGDNIENPVFENVVITNYEPIVVTSETFELNTINMIGCYAPMYVFAGDQSIMFMGTDNDNVVYCPTEDLVLNSFYAYFEIPSLQGEETSVQDCVIDFDSVGIQEIKNDDLRYLEGWYNILGVKLYKKPTERGVYINNGKKVIIK